MVEEKGNEQAQHMGDIPMAVGNAAHDRLIINNAGLHDSDTQTPVITRYHHGEWRPGMRQLILGSNQFSMWQGFHQPNKRLPVRDYTRVNKGNAVPIRIWDASQTGYSWPMNTYAPNPSQLTPNSVGMNAQTAQSSAQVWRSW